MTLLAPLEPAAAQVVAEQPAGHAGGRPRLARIRSRRDRPARRRRGARARTAATRRCPIASITKIVTALVVLDKHPLAVGEAGPTITMGAADVALSLALLRESTRKVFPVWVGLSFTERELLDLTLIESATNYAASLATWAFGSEAEFAAAARTWLDAHGLTEHHDRGADRPRPGNTRDRRRPSSSSAGSRSPIRWSREIVGTEELTIHDVGLLENTNELLGIVGRHRHQDRHARRVRSRTCCSRPRCRPPTAARSRSSASCSAARDRSTTSSTPT